MTEVQPNEFRCLPAELRSVAVHLAEPVSGESTFLVEGLISRYVTLVWGKSGAFKSTFTGCLVSALVGGDEQFLERTINRHPRNVLIFTTDSGEGTAMAKRIGASIAPENHGRVFCEAWDEYDMMHPSYDLNDLVKRQIDLVVIDHAQGTLVGTQSIKYDEDVRPLLDFARRVARLNIAVIIVHHSSEKVDRGTSAIGSSLFMQIPRCRVELHRNSKDVVTLTAVANAAPKLVTAFSVGREGDRLSLREEAVPRQRASEASGQPSQNKQKRLVSCEPMVQLLTEHAKALGRAIKPRDAARIMVDAGMMEGRETSNPVESARQEIYRSLAKFPAGVIASKARSGVGAEPG